jgi:hypothetical protein
MDTESTEKSEKKFREKGYLGRLERVIVCNSIAKTWEEAVLE